MLLNHPLYLSWPVILAYRLINIIGYKIIHSFCGIQLFDLLVGDRGYSFYD
jgi:hypothetical protein